MTCGTTKEVIGQVHGKETFLSIKTIGKWTVDLKNFTCSNTENQIIIAFEKKGTALVGKIKEIPDELLKKWAAEPDGKDIIKKAVIEADEIFFKEYFNREIERKQSMPAAV